MTPLKFNFNCFALCTVEEEEGEQPMAEIVGGFFASIEDAEKGADANELRIRGEHEQWRRKYPCFSNFPNVWEYPSRLHYEIVPLASVTFKSLDALEDAILQAARLQFVGVGKMVAA